MTRIYDGRTLVDWDVDPDAAVCPLDPAARALWGWQQDVAGRWYRDVPAGKKIGDLPAPNAVVSV